MTDELNKQIYALYDTLRATGMSHHDAEIEVIAQVSKALGHCKQSELPKPKSRSMADRFIGVPSEDRLTDQLMRATLFDSTYMGDGWEDDGNRD